MPFDTIQPGAWLITGIDVAHTERGKGVARGLMHRILADADKENITLYLSIEPDRSPESLDENQLRNWYHRLGFIPATSQSDIAMIRTPKG